MSQSYGSWPTPITSAKVVEAAAGLEGVYTDGDSIWWSESRPEEGGRSQVVQLFGDGPPVDLLPAEFNARTAVHEYGGGAWWARGKTLWFANWADQLLYRLTGRAMPIPVVPEPEQDRGDRWAEGVVEPGGRWMVVVREHHHPGGTVTDVRNELVVVDLQGEFEPRVLVSGSDFVSDPRLSPDNARLCWLRWDHPDMPWDGTELCLSPVSWTDTGPEIGEETVVAGRPHFAPGGDGDGESVTMPQFAPDGSLWFVSDRNDWWNLYRLADSGEVEVMVEMEAEIGLPQWIFGRSRYGFLDDGRVVFAFTRDGHDHLAVLDGERVEDIDQPYTVIPTLVAASDTVVLVGASATSEPAVVRIGFGSTVDLEVLRPPRDLGIDPSWFSVPESISFPTAGGETSHALFFPPTNPEVEGPWDELPPLLVMIHGGPTSATTPDLHIGFQYWTSRGFAVVDLNYRGSTGYGRPYRERLRGEWGVVDVEDAVAVARWLGEQGRVDPDRLCIRGGSAGGFTTLAALTQSDSFAAGASHFGVADLEALAIETHKFESRYLDGLIGPYPERRDLYRARSPIESIHRCDTPLAVFQGLEDEVVPPNQAEMIVEAMRSKGVPVSYTVFPDEQHGFRKAENIRKALDGELSFYSQLFGFELPESEDVSEIPIENLV